MATPSFHRPYEPFPRDLIPRLCTYVHTYVRTYIHTCLRSFVHSFVRPFACTYFSSFFWWLYSPKQKKVRGVIVKQRAANC